MQLRDYQSEAIDSVFRYFAEEAGNPLLVAPTGSGKSVILSGFFERACKDYPATRILCLSHVKEIIEQDYRALVRVWPDAKATIYSAGLGRKNLSGQIVFAGIQSFARVARRAGFFDLVLIDEAHLIPRKAGTQYQKTLRALAETNPQIKMIGLTATPYRLDSGMLHEGDDAVFDAICYDIPIRLLVERDYLCPLVSKKPKNVFDTSGLHTRMGDFIEKEMQERFDTDDINRAILSEAMHLAGDRKSWIAFCINVEHAEHMAAMLRSEFGKTAAAISGSTPPAERASLIDRFKRRELDVLTSVNVITTGFDAPVTDLIILARPTQSTGLYVQMLGRGMRPHHAKENCLVLDYAGNVLRHGPVDAINPMRPKKEGDGEAPAKECPECHEIIHAGLRECPGCGYIFPPPEPKVEKEAGTEAVMTLTAPEPAWLPVQDVDFSRHEKPGKPPSMRVDYLVDGKKVSEWVCPEHSGYARQKFVNWWHTRSTGMGEGLAIPDTVTDAIADAQFLTRPTYATLRRNGKYWNLERVRFDRPEDYWEAAE